MRKNFGAQSDIYPMPVFIVAAYDENGNANCMNAAWGGIYESNQIMVCLSHSHKTTKNIKISKAFTVSIADAKHVLQADYVGVVSGNKEPDKIEKAGIDIEFGFEDAMNTGIFTSAKAFCTLRKVSAEAEVLSNKSPARSIRSQLSALASLTICCGIFFSSRRRKSACSGL